MVYCLFLCLCAWLNLSDYCCWNRKRSKRHVVVISTQKYTLISTVLRNYVNNRLCHKLKMMKQHGHQKSMQFVQEHSQTFWVSSMVNTHYTSWQIFVNNIGTWLCGSCKCVVECCWKICVNLLLSGNVPWGRAIEWRTQLALSCIQERRWCATVVLACHIQHWAEDWRQRTEAVDGSWVPWEDRVGTQWGLQRRAGKMPMILLLCSGIGHPHSRMMSFCDN